jgi:ribokinase
MSVSDAAAPEVAVVGSVHMDLVAVAPRLPRRGESVAGSRFSIHPGGKAGNQAVAAARQGARTAIVASVGDDAFGRELREKLAEAAVDVSLVQSDLDAPTGASPILLDERGDYASIIAPGASLRLTPERLTAALPALRGCAVLLVQLEIALPTTLAAARAVHEAGGTVLLTAAPAPAAATDIPDELWRSVHLLLVNQAEAAALTGFAIRDSVSAGRAGELLVERLKLGVVITLGAAGVTLVTASESFVLPGHRVPVVDTVGAGDALAGAVAAALARGEPLWRAVELGNAAGALAVGRRGDFGAPPTLAETLDVLG